MGNARTFLVNWLLARQQNWRIILRVEDLDGPRVKTAADRAVIEDLRWLGLDWDDGPVYQSKRMARYTDALESLVKQGQVYPCVCTRREVEEAASAPHGTGPVYPGTCRGRFVSRKEAESQTGRPAALRFKSPSRQIEVMDCLRGVTVYDAKRDLGDFVVAKADGTPAYQLAVVVDDAEMGVTEVVRGDDLLDSAARQQLLYGALGWHDRIPRYTHLPLVVGSDGRRLAKRHGDTRLAYYRDLGVSADRMMGLLAGWCGIEIMDRQVTARNLLGSFSLEKLPRTPIVFTPSDDAALRDGLH